MPIDAVRCRREPAKRLPLQHDVRRIEAQQFLRQNRRLRGYCRALHSRYGAVKQDICIAATSAETSYRGGR
jgi:hypothetical protein